MLKTDSRGRVRTPAGRRESLLTEYEKSGLTAVKFAELAGIKYPTFAAWLQKRRRKAVTTSPAPGSVQWLEAVVTEAPTPDRTPPLSLYLPGGTRLELAEVKQVPLAVALVRALEWPC